MLARTGAALAGIALPETPNREPCHGERLVRGNAGLLQRDAHLLANGVYTVEVGQQHPAAKATGDDNAVAVGRQVAERARFAGAEHVDRAGEIVHLRFAQALKARIVKGRGTRVAGDLGGQAGLGRLQGSDAAAQLAMLLQRDETGGARREQRVPGRRRERPATHKMRDAGPRVVGGSIGRARLAGGLCRRGGGGGRACLRGRRHSRGHPGP